MSDPKDRFWRLREIIDAATPGPWSADEGFCKEDFAIVGADDSFVCEAPASRYDSCTIYEGNPADARFIATFDPETAREVVGLLEEALGLIDDAGPEEWTGPRQWHARLDALLDRIGGDQ